MMCSDSIQNIISNNQRFLTENDDLVNSEIDGNNINKSSLQYYDNDDVYLYFKIRKKRT